MTAHLDLISAGALVVAALLYAVAAVVRERTVPASGTRRTAGSLRSWLTLAVAVGATGSVLTVWRMLVVAYA